jgi:hypothetical protein
MSEEGSRADRLRRQRQDQRERVEQPQSDETDEPSQSSERSGISKPSKPDKLSERSEQSVPDQPDEMDETNGSVGETTSVKDEQIGTYMYLPKQQSKELERRYKLMSAEYEFEFDESFEKNRHFFPLIIQYGLDDLEGLDAAEIRDRIRQL